ncbi:MAG TPA: hypothetical protein VHZ76_01110 [Gammaproteobacteria bacterium]|jgi:hypothetical protein|nr:hypothetical protein [Gammaproteobacteria bacterium]
MVILKKFALCLFAAAISSYAYADIIELDAVNPDHCRQQILQSTDNLPIIAAYTSNQYDDNSKLFMEKFELLAKAHPERTFFKWDAEKDVGHLTQSICLQQLGLLTPPTMMLLGVFKDDNSDQMFMSSPLRLEWAGQITREEMNKFIDVSDPNIKKAFLSQKNHP